MASDEKAVVFKFQLAGAQDVARGAQSMSGAMQQTGPAAQSAGTGLFKLQGIAQVAARNLSMLGGPLAGLNQAMGGVAAGALNLTQVLGAGTGLGLAVTAIGVGVGVLTDHWRRSSAAAEQKAEALKKLEASTRGYSNVLAQLTKQEAAIQLGKKLWYGEAGDLETKAFAADARAKAERLAATMREGKLTYEENAKANLEIKRLRESAARAEATFRATRSKDVAESAVSEGETLRDIEVKSAEARAAEKLRIHADYLSALEKADREAAARRERLGELEEFMRPRGLSKEELEGLAAMKEIENTKLISDREIEYGNAVLANFLANEEAKRAAIEETSRIHKEAALGAFSVVAQTGGKALQDLVKGKKVEAAATIETIGDGLYADGFANTLKALAMMWIPGLNAVAAPGLLAAGGAEMLAGLGMGAAGAAMGSSGSTGPSGGGSTFTRQADQYRVEPVESSAPIIVHVNTLNPSRETGRVIVESIRQANNSDTSLQIPRTAVSA